ncbi:hypothetical protein Hanom_Chr14g01322711 [Helianthus anomalus]
MTTDDLIFQKTNISNTINLLLLFSFQSKLQVVSFMFVPDFRRCPLPLKLMSFVLYVSKSSTLCPLGQTQLDFLVKFGHMPCT